MPDQPDAGRAFGPYRMVRLIGSGGMGEVWEAVDTRKRNGPTIAVKLLSAAYLSDPLRAERFRRESQFAAAVSHPNVLPVYEYGEIDGRPFIAMRRVVGTDLDSEIKRIGALPPARAIWIVAQVASALDAAHTRGLRHRDVKPSNVMLEPGPWRDADHASLIDWGIAQPIDSSQPGVTRTDTIVGSLSYMAPERLVKDGSPDHRADIYALAVSLYEALAGQLPFDGEQAAVVVGHLHRQPPPLPGSVPGQLQAVLDVGLAKSPADRFQTAKGLAEAARAALGTAVGPAGPVTALGPVRGAPAPTEATTRPDPPIVRGTPGSRPRGAAEPRHPGPAPDPTARWAAADPDRARYEQPTAVASRSGDEVTAADRAAPTRRASTAPPWRNAAIGGAVGAVAALALLAAGLLDAASVLWVLPALVAALGGLGWALAPSGGE